MTGKMFRRRKQESPPFSAARKLSGVFEVTRGDNRFGGKIRGRKR